MSDTWVAVESVGCGDYQACVDYCNKMNREHGRHFVPCKQSNFKPNGDISNIYPWKKNSGDNLTQIT